MFRALFAPVRCSPRCPCSSALYMHFVARSKECVWQCETLAHHLCTSILWLPGTLHSACTQLLGTFCKPKFGNFDGNGPRPGERCERKWRIFAKIHPNVRLEGPGTEQNFRFGSAWPVRVCPCGHVLRQFGIAGRRINFCSFCLFFSYVNIFEIVKLYSVNFVFSSSCSMFSSSELQAITKPSISPSEGVVS